MRLERKLSAEKQKLQGTSEGRIKKFRRSVKYGPCFVCCCCDQLMVENGVQIFDDKTQKQIKDVQKERFEKIFEKKLVSEEYKITIKENEISTSSYYLCHTCKKHLVKGKLPPMSVANGLSLVKIDDNDLNLTELENNLIAKKILFQKVFKLPKTRMAAVKDKLVNIPLNDEDVINTIKNLPRTPTEAGLLEVKLKRKMEYKNYHQYEYISPDKIFKSLKYLKKWAIHIINFLTALNYSRNVAKLMTLMDLKHCLVMKNPQTCRCNSK